MPRILLFALLLAGWTQDAETPEAGFATTARAALTAGKDAAAQRLREAKEAVAADTREEAERDSRFALALKAATTRSPLPRVTIDKSVPLDNVRVTDYAAGIVTLTWPQGEVRYPVSMLSDETRSQLIGIALSKGSARDHFEVGKVLVRGKDYDGAARCFAGAVKLDSTLAPAVPDVERLRRAAKLFEGSFKVTGSSLSLRWGFSSKEEAADFQALQGDAKVQPGSGLEVFSPKLALAAIKEIPFRNRVRLSAMPKETDKSAHLLAIRFVKPDGGVVLFYGALATAYKTFMVVRVEDDKSTQILPATAGAVGNRMTMDYNRGRMTFQVGDKTVWAGNEGAFTDVLAVVGAVALNSSENASASALFKEISLQGEVNPVWMTKKTAGMRDAFASELAKEYRAKRGDAAAGSLSLSVDGGLKHFPPFVQDYYRAALVKIAAMQKSQLEKDREFAQEGMEQMTRGYPTLPPAWYYLGRLQELGGNRRAAAESYERALALLPEFPEAIAGRARLQILAGAWAAAREDVDKALLLKPDLAQAQLLSARLLWEARDAAGVIERTQTARKLAPADPDIQTDAQQLANVARGPRWAKPSVHQTAHYVVRSDLPPARCKAYAEHLEAVRGHYEEALGRPLPAGRPADVLIFESEEGYFIYNDYTIGTRLEHALGAFSSWLGQLALFEGVDVQETPKTLAHEGFHQALHSIAPDVPQWFNEGMAEYVGAARVEKGSVVERGGILSGRLENLTTAVKYGWQPVAFAALMQQTRAEFYDEQAALKYAQAWSMIRYFMDGDGGRWKPVLRDYIKRLIEGAGPKTAFDETFGRQEVPQMEAGWLKYYSLVPRTKPVVKPPPGTPAGSTGVVGAPVDIFPLLENTGVKAATGWTLTGGLLECIRIGTASLDLPFEPPPEYDWTLSIRRTGGRNALVLGLQAGGSTFVLRLDDNGMNRLDQVDGTPPIVPKGVLPPGKVVAVTCSVRSAGVTVSVGGDVLLEWKGDYKRLSYLRERNMPPPTKSLFLHSDEAGFQISAMSIATAASGPAPAGPAADTSKPAPPEIKVDPAKSIALDAELVRWLSDEDGRQILALDRAGNLLQISTADRKVVKKIRVGAGAASLFPAPGSGKSVWVGNPEAGGLVRVDLDKGEIAETVNTSCKPDSLIVLRRLAYCLSSDGALSVYDMADKKELGMLTNFGSFSSIAYDLRKDRIWLMSGGVLIEFETTKLGPMLKELGRKNPNNKEYLDLWNALSQLGKRHSLANADLATVASARIYLDERTGRIYSAGAVSKADKSEAVLGTYKSPAHGLDKEPAVRSALSKVLCRDQILAASGDGRWVVSGSHLFNAATYAVKQELPLPTPMAAFSRDSKELYWYDWVNRAVGILDLDPK